MMRSVAFAMYKNPVIAVCVSQLLTLHIGCGPKTATVAAPSTSTAGGESRPPPARNVDNDELFALYVQDQADRKSDVIDWRAVAQRDIERQQRVRELLDAGAVQTGADYHHAALVFQHSGDVAGIELAHELAMIALAMGDRDARWLAAASYDRLLTRLDRPQRFGTQYISKGGDDPMHLAPIEPGVTDGMRAALNCPVLGRIEE